VSGGESAAGGEVVASRVFGARLDHELLHV
jgi:hypothetical protein